MFENVLSNSLSKVSPVLLATGAIRTTNPVNTNNGTIIVYEIKSTSG